MFRTATLPVSFPGEWPWPSAFPPGPRVAPRGKGWGVQRSFELPAPGFPRARCLRPSVQILDACGLQGVLTAPAPRAELPKAVIALLWAGRLQSRPQSGSGARFSASGAGITAVVVTVYCHWTLPRGDRTVGGIKRAPCFPRIWGNSTNPSTCTRIALKRQGQPVHHAPDAPDGRGGGAAGGKPGPELWCETLSLSNQRREFVCFLICRHSLLT